MPVFYFNVRDGGRLIQDTAGAELHDLEAARNCALRFARQVLADKVERGEIIDGTVFEISNRAGTVLTTVPFSDAIRLE